jgi:hypothetical protein
MNGIRVAIWVLGLLSLLEISYWILRRIGRRSGVSDQDLVCALPGDDLLENPNLIADRATLIDASADRVWPWLIQFGKGRAGWYMPRWVEFLLPKRWRGAREIIPKFQVMQIGDIIPDYGPGNGAFKVAVLRSPYTLVYYSVRLPSAGWGWVDERDPRQKDAIKLSWALLLEEKSSEQYRFYIRLRANLPSRNMTWINLFGGLVDYLTIVLLFAGLKERVQNE